MRNEKIMTYIIDQEDVKEVAKCEELLRKFISYDSDFEEQIKGENNEYGIVFDFLSHLNFIKYYIDKFFDSLKEMSKTDLELADIVKEALFEEGDGNEY